MNPSLRLAISNLQFSMSNVATNSKMLNAKSMANGQWLIANGSERSI